MSRIGKLPIVIPKTVTVEYCNSKLIINGKFGTLKRTIPKTLTLEQKNDILYLNPNQKTRNIKSLYGLYRTLISNMVIGVSEQFQITLVLHGVGYRAAVQNTELVLNLGFSHPVKITIPKSISIEVVKNNTINLKSCDKELLGLFASNIRSWRKPEPYKGKGILYKDEQILRKAGKSGK